MGDLACCVVLASGSGTNLQALLDEAARGQLGAKIAAVASDRPHAQALERARTYGVTAHPLAPASFANRVSYDQALAGLVAQYQPQIVVLAGFMRFLSPEFVAPFADRLINIHPSLLPAFRGLHTHRRVLEAGCRIHGTTTHFVTEELDAGPIIAQAALAVHSDDNPESLESRIKGLEHRLLPQTIRWFVSGRIEQHNTGVTVHAPRQPAPELIVPALDA